MTTTAGATEMHFMPKNIVVYFAMGQVRTGAFRPGATHQQRLQDVQIIPRASGQPDQPTKQVCINDPGLGTDGGTSGLTGMMRRIDKRCSR